MATHLITTTVNATYIGGPTVLLEVAGLRLLTDPTFDPPGGSYPLGNIVLKKNGGPALSVEELGPIDAVLLSHDQHSDNLDRSGRALLPKVPRIFTTVVGMERLEVKATGLRPWESAILKTPSGDSLHITATPARHGPAGIEPITGEVIGFMLSLEQEGYRKDLVYVTGDTVWYEGIAEVARRFTPATVLIFGGAAQPRGPFNVTMGANDAIDTAQAFPEAQIVPLHHEGWEHYTQTQAELASAFATLRIDHRLFLLQPGVPTALGKAGIE
jgi:L-ascorbate metabolism protein UlaG (beta-lactamase superfamily)